tara:strand:- start:1239 stop:3005 length:1767 start_codon:yes stop_codon:yes gene_type:complete
LHLYIYGKQSIENKLYFFSGNWGDKNYKKGTSLLDSKKIISIKPKSLKNFLFIIIGTSSLYFRFLWSHLSQWKHEEAVILWISLTKSFFDSPFSNVSSPGVPNPNLSILLSKILILFDSFIISSIVLSTIQGIAIYYCLKSSDKNFNFILVLFLCFSSYFVFVTSTIALHMIVLIFNALFLKIVFEYCFSKKYYLGSYFPIVTILPVSIYLGGFSNTLIYFLIFIGVLIFNIRNLKMNFSNKFHFGFGTVLVVSILYLTWYKYFINIDFDSLKIQNSGTQLFPYSRIRDYIFLGYQNTKIFPSFFLNVFSDTTYIYWPFQYSDKFSLLSTRITESFLIYHKVFNIISSILIFSGLVIRFSKFKTIVNTEILLKTIFTFLLIYIYTVLTPLLGQGRSFLDFDIGSLMVYSSTYILYIYLWVSSFFIFRPNKLFLSSFVLFVSSFFLLNIFATNNLQNEFNNGVSVGHSVADEPIIHKEEVVDFLANYVDDDISIYYGLIEFEYEWSNYFNEINYSSNYYQYIYSIGREFDYLLKRKYNVDNLQEGILNRNPENTQFYLSYSYDDLPKDIYQNFTHFQFGNYIVTVNLDF